MKRVRSTVAESVATSVEQVRPALLKDRHAAQYLGLSSSWLRAKRLADARACREGEPTTGPLWVTIGSSVFYRLSDLDAWIAANVVERGVVAFANRGTAATSTPSSK